MSTRDCIAKVIEASKGRLSEDDIADLTDQVGKRADARRREFPLETRQQNLAAIAKEMADEEALEAMIEKRNRTINVLVRKNIYARVDSLPGKEATAISSLNGGSERGFDGAARSVDSLTRGNKDALIGPMMRDLRKAGLVDILAARTAAFDEDLAVELWRVSDDAAEASGNAKAEEAAKIIAPTQEAARVMQNQRGAFIRKVPGWIVRQTHDAVAIAAAEFPRWRDAILPRLDERTFDGVKDRDAFLKHAFKNIVKGIHNKQGGADGWLSGFKGYSNRAKKVSQERVLHFKSGRDWFAYNQEFGSKSLLEAVVGGLESAARNAALMEIWGTNPEAMFRDVVNQVSSRDTISKTQRNKLNDWFIEGEFMRVNGTADTGGLPSRARLNANIRGYINTTTLGGVVLAQFSDLPAHASALRHNGVSYFDGLANSFESLMRGKGDADQRAVADTLNAGLDGLIGSVAHRLSVNEDMGDRINRLQRTFFKFNLQQFWNDSMKTGLGLMMSRTLANFQSTAFDKLPNLLQINFRRYGIGAKEWELFRTLDTKLAKGQRHLTADAIDNLSDDAIKAYAGVETKGSVSRIRSDLKVKLNSYYGNEIRVAMTEPGARERTMATFGTSAGTYPGQAVRYFMQFKTFGITFASRHIAREFLRTGQLDKTGLFALIAGMTTLGYISMTAKEWVKGKNPRKVEDMGDAAEVVGAAMAQGGGFGIYGDFLFGEYSRMGKGVVETAAGPAVGKAADLFRLFGEIKEWSKGERQKAPAALAFKSVAENVPFQNLFYAKWAADHFILFKIQEAMNPGYLKRMESRVKQDNNQSYWLAPTSAVR